MKKEKKKMSRTRLELVTFCGKANVITTTIGTYFYDNLFKFVIEYY